MNTRFTLSSAMIATTFAIASSAQAALFDFKDGNGPIDIGNFDFGPANVLAVGATTAIENFIGDGLANFGGVPDPANTDYHFDVFIHATLLATTDSNGNANTPTGLNNDFQITMVMGFGERLTQVLTSPPSNNAQASFATLPDLTDGNPSFFEIWYDTSIDATHLSGAGFNDGTRIFASELTDDVVEGNFSTTNPDPVDLDQFNNNDYLAVDSVTGNGSNDNFIIDTNSPPAIIDASFFIQNMLLELSLLDVNQNVPFNNVDPSRCFVGTSGGTGSANCINLNDGTFSGQVGDSGTIFIPTVGTVNGQFPGQGGGPDFIFRTDFNARVLAQVPEPMSLALLGLGLGALGFSVTGRKHRHTKA